MKQPNLRIVRVALVVLVSAGWWIGMRSSGSAVAPGAVALGSGSASGSVQLVVDFGAASGKPTFVKSIDGFEGTGWQLLEAAGLKVQGTDDYPKSFACRIDGWPTETAQNCADTPSFAEGSWKYFVASPEQGSGWIVSGVGVAGHRSTCGQAEAWVFVSPGTDATKVVPSVKPTVFKCEG